MGVLSISDVTEVIVLALMISFLDKNMTGKKLFLTHHLILFPFVAYNEITKVRIIPLRKTIKYTFVDISLNIQQLKSMC